MTLYVYCDERYPTSWIRRDVVKQIVRYLEERGFTVIDANELGKVVSNGISNPREKITIVFAQDVIPAILLDNPSKPTANSPIRKFLNVGHTIVWLGDVPLIYVGFDNGQRAPITDAYRTVLGIPPVTSNIRNRVTLTQFGFLFGLPVWIGSRPHELTSSEHPKVTSLAYSLHQSRRVNHAFVANYTGDYLRSGFIRIYDFPMNELLPREYLEALYRIATFRDPIGVMWVKLVSLEKVLREIKELVETRFSTVKNELDNLEKLIKKVLNVPETE